MNVAFIPVRGGSKSIPLKNIKEIAGRPLVYWVVKAACECKYLDKVYVATDHDGIKETVLSFGFPQLQVIDRSAETASDHASTESAMLEFAQKVAFDHIVLIQATSPLLRSVDLDRGFEAYDMPDTDSVLSVVRQKRFFWEDKDGYAVPTNYDVFHRPMRQDFDGCLVENGAFYITSKKALLETKNRISGKIRYVEMPENTYYEIDEPSDWEIIEAMMLQRKDAVEVQKRPSIKMFLTDCDGCLTDGGMYYTQQGDELKKLHTFDGMGFQLLAERGILRGIITGEDTAIVKRRAEKLKLDILKMGVKNKLHTVKELCEQYNITLDEVAYIGDDINDKELLDAVGFSVSVPNAMDEVKKNVDYVTKRIGGEGAVREAIEVILNHH